MSRFIMAIIGAVSYGHRVGYRTAWLRGYHIPGHKLKGSKLVERWVSENSDMSDMTGGVFVRTVELRRCRCGIEFVTTDVRIKSSIEGKDFI
jgi:hypothetical protein